MCVCFDDLPDLLTAKEARVILRLSRNRIYTAIKEGVVPSIRIGRKVLIPKQGIADWIAVTLAGGKTQS